MRKLSHGCHCEGEARSNPPRSIDFMRLPRQLRCLAMTLIIITLLTAVPSSSRAADLGSILGSAIGGVTKLAAAAKDITPAEEHYIGRAVAAIIISTRPLYNNGALTQYINDIGGLLASASDRPSTYAGYHFAVLNSDEANAYACPGGLILINKGLLKEVKSEDQLAAVLAHEVAHVAHRHGINAIKKSRWTDLGFYAAGEVGKQYSASEVGQLVGAFQDVVGNVAKQVIESGYSKKDEKDADMSGMSFAAGVGYDPNAMIEFMRESKAEAPKGPFSSHPKKEVRISSLEPRAKELASEATSPAARVGRFKAAMASVR